MFMRRPSYLGEDSGGQAIVGESSQIVKQYWNDPKIVSQTVSHWLSESPNSLLLMQLELEARVGIERGSFTVPSLTHSVSRPILALFYRGSSNFLGCSFNVTDCPVTAPV